MPLAPFRFPQKGRHRSELSPNPQNFFTFQLPPRPGSNNLGFMVITSFVVVRKDKDWGPGAPDGCPWRDEPGSTTQVDSTQLAETCTNAPDLGHRPLTGLSDALRLVVAGRTRGTPSCCFSIKANSL